MTRHSLAPCSLERQDCGLPVDVDSDAHPRTTEINSEIKYKAIKRRDSYLQEHRIPVEIKATTSSLVLPAAIIIIVIIAASGYLYERSRKRLMRR